MLNAYTIGVNLAVTSNFGQINQNLNGLQRQVGALNQLFHGHQMKRWGENILEGMKSVIETGKELNSEFVRSLTLGGQIAEQAAKIKGDSIAGSMNLPGWAPSQLTKLTNELSTQVGLPEAQEMRDLLAKMGTVLSFSTGGKDGGPEALLAAFKATEAVGGAYKDDGHGGKEFSQEKFERYMNSLTASIIASGGLFSTRDAMMATRQASASLRMMEPEVLFPYLAEASIQMGAPKAGTATMSWARQFGGGVMTPRAALAMEKIGLLHPGEWHKNGNSVVVADEARRRLAEALKDPPKWAKEVLMPKMDGKSNADLMAVLMSLASTQTVARIITDLEQNNPQFFRMRENAANVPSVDKNFDTINNKSVEQNINNTATAWKGLQEVVTDAMAPQLITGMHAITDALHGLTMWASSPEHHTAVLGLAGLTAALGALLTVTGSLRLLQFVIGARAFATTMQVLLGLTGLPAMAGTLGMIWNGLAFLAGISGLTAAAGALTALATSIGAIVGAVKGFAMSPEDSARAMQKLEGLGHQRLLTPPSNMVPQDGYNPDGSPAAQPMGYHVNPPAGRSMHVNLTGSVPITADGRTIAHVVGERLAATMAAPPRGSYSPDPSMSVQWGPALA